MRRLIIACFLFLGFTPLYGQQLSLDSLETLSRKLYRVNIDSSKYYAEVSRIQANKEGNNEQYAWALNWKGICFLKIGPPDSALHYFDECASFSEKNNIPGTLGKANLNKSIYLFQRGEFQKSVESGLNSLKGFDQGQDTMGIAHANYNLALSYLRLELFEEAQQCLGQARIIYEERGGVLDLANLYNAIGSRFSSLLQIDSAMTYYEKAIEVKESVGGWAHCGSEYSNIGAIYQDRLNDSSNAMSAYKQSLECYEALQDGRGIATVSGNLAKYYAHYGYADSAALMAAKCVEYADYTDDIWLLQSAYSALYKSKRESGDFEEALFYHLKYNELRDSISSLEIQEKVADLQLKYDVVKKDEELAKTELALTNSQLTGVKKDRQIAIWALLAFIGAALLIVGLLFYRSKRRKLVAKAKEQIHEERSRISMDLHDHIGAELTIISSKLDTQAFKAQDTNSKEMLENLAGQSRDAFAQLRDTIWSVQKDQVDVMELQVRIDEFGKKACESKNILWESDLTGQGNLNPALALDIYRVMQEGISNALKHSQTDKVKLLMRVKARQLHIALSDFGVGIPEDVETGRYGLSNMKERILKYEGKIDFQSDQGTQIIIQIPLPNVS